LPNSITPLKDGLHRENSIERKKKGLVP